MIRTISDLFYRYTRGWLIAGLLLIFVGFMALTLPGITAVSQNIEGLDTQFFYTPQQAFANVAAYSAEARTALNRFHLTVDIANPLLYSGFLALLLSWLFQRSFMAAPGRRLLNIFPLGALLFDVLENVSITIMMTAYPAQPVWAAWLATISTMFKFSILYASFVLVLVGAVGALLARFTPAATASAPKLEEVQK